MQLMVRVGVHLSFWYYIVSFQKFESCFFLFFLLHMQALYFCVPFREQLLDYYSNNKNPSDTEENLLTCLADLFLQVNYIWNWLNIKSNNSAG